MESIPSRIETNLPNLVFASGLASAGSSGSMSAVSDASGDTLVSEGEAESPTSLRSLGKRYLRGELSDIEKTALACKLQSSAQENPAKIAFDIHYVRTFFDTHIDLDANEALKKELQIAFREFQNIKVAASFWTKWIFLSSKRRAHLKERVEYGGNLISYLDKVCGDARGIREEIQWIKNPYGQLESGEKYEQKIVFKKEEIDALVYQAAHNTSSHIDRLRTIKTGITHYIEQTESFIRDMNRACPKTGFIDRAGTILLSLPSVVGGLITAIAYLLGGTSLLAFVPLAVGMATSIIGAVLTIANVVRFIPTERVQQEIHERERVKDLFPEILKLLEKVIVMDMQAAAGTNKVNLGFSEPLCEAHFYNGVTILRKEGEDAAVIQKQIIELQQKQPELVKAIVDKAVEEKITELKADFDAKLEYQTKLLLEAIKGKA